VTGPEDPSRRSAPLPSPGEAFHRYRLGPLLSRGAFGRVFRADDLELGRGVALKVFSRVDDDDDRLRRFWREAELSRGLVHPHTVRVYDYGIGPGSIPFIALELLDGESLHQRLKRNGPFSVEETRRIAGSVLKALMEAHSHGIVHRDIKPSNVFLCRYAGEDDFVKVLDFGIAKAPSRDLTARGWLVGTPAYMAPEQVSGAALTPSADLYSLGVLMVTMLTGVPLLTGSTREILLAQLAPEPLDLPRAVLESELGWVIRRATIKDPSRRYVSAREMLADLEGVLELGLTRYSTLTGLGEDPDSYGFLVGRSRRRSSGAPSFAPVAYTLAEPAPKQHAVHRRVDRKLVAALAFALVNVVFAASAAGLALRPTRQSLHGALGAHDPALAAPLVRARAERAGFSIRSERRAAPNVVDFEFEKAGALGVLRVENLGSAPDARWWEEQVRGDKGRASVRRGPRVIGLWAAPPGKTGFETRESELLVHELFP
jgi:Protein kinase domain